MDLYVHCFKVCSSCGQDNSLCRCQNCGLPNNMCSACDEKVHSTLALHDQEVWHNGYSEPISSVTNESTITQGKTFKIGIVCTYHQICCRKGYSFNLAKILSPLWQRRNGYSDITIRNKNICKLERYIQYTS